MQSRDCTCPAMPILHCHTGLARFSQVPSMNTKNTPKSTAPDGNCRTTEGNRPGRICPCGCGKLAKPFDPGYGCRLTIFGKSGYWRKACIARLRKKERSQIDRGGVE